MSSLFKVNKPSEPSRMPTMDDTEAKRAAARAQQLLTSRSGRSSTVMSRTGQGSSGGTTPYGNKLMGQS